MSSVFFDMKVAVDSACTTILRSRLKPSISCALGYEEAVEAVKTRISFADTDEENSHNSQLQAFKSKHPLSKENGNTGSNFNDMFVIDGKRRKTSDLQEIPKDPTPVLADSIFQSSTSSSSILYLPLSTSTSQIQETGYIAEFRNDIIKLREEIQSLHNEVEGLQGLRTEIQELRGIRESIQGLIEELRMRCENTISPSNAQPSSPAVPARKFRFSKISSEEQFDKAEDELLEESDESEEHRNVLVGISSFKESFLFFDHLMFLLKDPEPGHTLESQAGIC